MPPYTIINGTEGTLSNVDGSGTHVDPMSFKDQVALDTAHLLALVDGNSFGTAIAVTTELATVTWPSQAKRAIAVAGLFPSS